MMWEAARYRLPCISSNANSLGRDVKEYGLGVLFEAEDAESLVNAIQVYKVLPPQVINLYRRNGRKFVESHSDTKWVEKCVGVYERLLNE
jgi:glycosyltransferase involved in cell wall biosynthesis